VWVWKWSHNSKRTKRGGKLGAGNVSWADRRPELLQVFYEMFPRNSQLRNNLWAHVPQLPLRTVEWTPSHLFLHAPKIVRFGGTFQKLLTSDKMEWWGLEFIDSFSPSWQIVTRRTMLRRGSFLTTLLYKGVKEKVLSRLLFTEEGDELVIIQTLPPIILRKY